MQELNQKVKVLRNKISVCIQNASELAEGERTVDICVTKQMEAFMLLGKVLSALGEPNPYVGEEKKTIADFDISGDVNFVRGELPIHATKRLRAELQEIISSPTWNALIENFTEFRAEVRKFDLNWHLTMEAMTTLMMAKMWAGMYLNWLLNKETEEEKLKRLAIENKSDESVVKEVVHDAVPQDQQGKYEAGSDPLESDAKSDENNDQE